MKNNKHSKAQKNIDGIVTTEEMIGAKEDPKTTQDPITTPTETPKTEKVAAKSVNKTPKKVKPAGFLKKTLMELKLVEWPSFKYVAGWSLTIILFTGMIGSVMGFTDYYFESGIQFVDCTSPNGSKNKSVQDCLKDLTSNLTFQKYFGQNTATAGTTTTATPAADNAVTTDQNSIPISPVTQPTITSEGNQPSKAATDVAPTNGTPIPTTDTQNTK